MHICVVHERSEGAHSLNMHIFLVNGELKATNEHERASQGGNAYNMIRHDKMEGGDVSF